MNGPGGARFLLAKQAPAGCEQHTDLQCRPATPCRLGPAPTCIPACKPARGGRGIQAPPRVGPHAIAAGQRCLVLTLQGLASQELQPGHRAGAAARRRGCSTRRRLSAL